MNKIISLLYLDRVDDVQDPVRALSTSDYSTI